MTDFSRFDDQAEAVAVQKDGKIVAAGSTASEETGGDFALARYNADGSLDSSFGSGGKVATDFGLWEEGHAVALQGDGKIVAAGFTGFLNVSEDFALARYNPDGTLDPSFGSGGKVATDFAGGIDEVFGLAIQGDGKIVAAGFASGGTRDFALARYKADGTLDTSFGSGGKVLTDFAGVDDVARAVAVQADGRIVTVGYSRQIFSFDFALARYNGDGTLDPGFGAGGLVITDFFDLGDSEDRAYAMALQPDGKIVAAGTANAGSSGEHFGLARYNSDGSLDPGFGSGGEEIFFFGVVNFARGVTLQADGKIVAAGGDNDFLLLRLNPDGTPDPSFGTGGETTTDFGGEDFATAVAIQPDGKIVAAGSSSVVLGDARFALARYLGSSSAPRCTVTGTPGPDILRGTNGDDVICGLGGGDILIGGSGNDTLQGGPGDDILLGSEGDDVIIGGPGADRLIGGPGNDVLMGMDGVSANDKLRGGDGSDTCTADPGDDLAGCP